jgi:hypothetical protein
LKTQYPTIIPADLLPKHKRPLHHKLDIIRAIEYRKNPQGQLVENTTYRGRRRLQAIECKYSTDGNTWDTINNIHNIYKALKQAIIKHNKKKQIQVSIIPIGISRTCNFQTRTLAEIAQLVSFEDNPPDTITYKSLPKQAQTIAMTIHVHAQEWYTLMSKVSRSTLTQRRKTTKQTTTNNNDK